MRRATLIRLSIVLLVFFCLVLQDTPITGQPNPPRTGPANPPSDWNTWKTITDVVDERICHTWCHRGHVASRREMGGQRASVMDCQTKRIGRPECKTARSLRQAHDKESLALLHLAKVLVEC